MDEDDNQPPIPTGSNAQVLLAEDSEGRSVALGALMGLDFITHRPGDSPQLKALKWFFLGLGHTFDQMQDVEWAHDMARARIDHGGEALADVHARLKAAATAETFVRLMCGLANEFLELLHGKGGCLATIEAWSGWKDCIDRMPAAAQDSWRRLRAPEPAVRAVLVTIRNAGAFHIGEGDLERVLPWVADRLPQPFFGHFTFSEDRKAARYIACDLAAEGIRKQATEDAGITWDDLNRVILDVQAIGVHLMPELATGLSGGNWTRGACVMTARPRLAQRLWYDGGTAIDPNPPHQSNWRQPNPAKPLSRLAGEVDS